MNTSQTLRPMPADAGSDASSDAELVNLAVAGNDLAFAQIMRRYNRQSEIIRRASPRGLGRTAPKG